MDVSGFYARLHGIFELGVLPLPQFSMAGIHLALFTTELGQEGSTLCSSSVDGWHGERCGGAHRDRALKQTRAIRGGHKSQGLLAASRLSKQGHPRGVAVESGDIALNPAQPGNAI